MNALQINSRRSITLALVVGLALGFAAACTPHPTITEADVRATMTALAGPEMRGRGSATADELRAAEYIAARLKAMGVAPAGDAGGYLQQLELRHQAFASAPTLTIGPWSSTHGAGFVVSRVDAAEISGPLQRWKEGVPTVKGAMVLLPPGSRAGREVLAAGAAAAIYSDDPRFAEFYPQAQKQMPQFELQVGSIVEKTGTTLILDAESTRAIARVRDGAPVRFSGTLAPPEVKHTRNVLGIIPGKDPARADEVIMLSAHFDHVGVDPSLTGDQVFDGADDDASGVTAVLELSRVLAADRKHKRTVLVALFGSEELGLLGSRHFLDHPPVPLKSIVANLEFEMIGRADPAVPAKTLWLTGYTYSDLGPTLAKQGARLVDDPHPQENFFQRSDNYMLVQRGVIAHTVSSFGLHQDYHQPSDDLSKIDFAHMTEAIRSLQAPLRWLLDSDFVPKWNEGWPEGKKP